MKGKTLKKWKWKWKIKENKTKSIIHNSNMKIDKILTEFSSSREFQINRVLIEFSRVEKWLDKNEITSGFSSSRKSSYIRLVWL